MSCKSGRCGRVNIGPKLITVQDAIRQLREENARLKERLAELERVAKAHDQVLGVLDERIDVVEARAARVGV